MKAGLPPAALADACALADEVWLPPAQPSPAQCSAVWTPARTSARDVAERAAAHPLEPDALLLAAHLPIRPALAPRW
ncbi:hypothetical protein [Streptomyces sp. NPDC003247]|uniref:hypothetical protein n=1 Tax=Streptomyces sp. NPDC003247 TaxID=3364677 RepID=UPI0036929C04